MNTKPITKEPILVIAINSNGDYEELTGFKREKYNEASAGYSHIIEIYPPVEKTKPIIQVNMDL